MAHPEREPAVRDLLARIDPIGEHNVEVAWDDEGPASGNADRVWRTARQAWRLAGPGADWHVVLQDDALPAAGLIEGLHEALKHVPPTGTAVSLYLGQGRQVPDRWAKVVRLATERQACWIRSDKINWGVGLALPVDRIDEMIGEADRMARVPDDMRVAGWVRKNRIDVWYPFPSLVDHKPIPSLTKHHAHDRRAAGFLGSETEVSWVDWAGPVMNDPMLTMTRGPRSGPRNRRQVG